MKTRTILLCCLIALPLLAAGCAPQTHPSAGPPEAPAGFLKGLWHGFILLFTFLVSLFRDGVGVYDTHNNGNLYNLGYVLGVMLFFGGSGGGACKKSC